MGTQPGTATAVPTPRPLWRTIAAATLLAMIATIIAPSTASAFEWTDSYPLGEGDGGGHRLVVDGDTIYIALSVTGGDQFRLVEFDGQAREVTDTADPVVGSVRDIAVGHSGVYVAGSTGEEPMQPTLWHFADTGDGLELQETYTGDMGAFASVAVAASGIYTHNQGTLVQHGALLGEGDATTVAAPAGWTLHQVIEIGGTVYVVADDGDSIGFAEVTPSPLAIGTPTATITDVDFGMIIDVEVVEGPNGTIFMAAELLTADFSAQEYWVWGIGTDGGFVVTGSDNAGEHTSGSLIYSPLQQSLYAAGNIYDPTTLERQHDSVWPLEDDSIVLYGTYLVGTEFAGPDVELVFYTDDPSDPFGGGDGGGGGDATLYWDLEMDVPGGLSIEWDDSSVHVLIELGSSLSFTGAAGTFPDLVVTDLRGGPDDSYELQVVSSEFENWAADMHVLPREVSDLQLAGTPTHTGVTFADVTPTLTYADQDLRDGFSFASAAVPHNLGEIRYHLGDLQADLQATLDHPIYAGIYAGQITASAVAGP